jgi:hypothetical protein
MTIENLVIQVIHFIYACYGGRAALPNGVPPLKNGLLAVALETLLLVFVTFLVRFWDIPIPKVSIDSKHPIIVSKASTIDAFSINIGWQYCI